MGSTPADSEREINRIRGDMTAAVEELERRVRGGLRTVASAEARITSIEARDEALQRVRDNPALLGVGGVVVAGAVAYGVFAAVNGIRERNTPRNRLKRRVKHAGGELSGRVAERVEGARRVLMLKLDPAEGGYTRVSDARLDLPPSKRRGLVKVIKKLVWAGLLSLFLAFGSVLARRVAGRVWEAMVHEEPPGSDG